ncbi:MAG TPA: NAD(P)H-dependent glycerol-3-phosphate dehydrogenase [Candidatus Ornithomonoglobus merdipullorum]|uniref:Glycerol-3-phosphate dehydrogenase [NAD(P)+] n=1 Tax=Candidatus Ornithomonoglobus merdipullorum TaxID=2840895 RepID=A0A9D1MDX2_9FIRM|nr:NAD(P)H-dependent glycerol-3-phosphate dehydrogenase [Candidatus Ornithomonoglobus merdipullorum]
MKIAVIGSGGWGTAISVLLAGKGNDVYLWSWIQEETDRLNRDRENKEFLPGVRLPESIVCSHDMEKCINGAEIVVTAAPSPATRTTAKQMAPYIVPGQKIVNISKGLEGELRLSEVYRSEIPEADISVLSGPSHAEEVSRGIPTTVVVASESKETAEFLQDAFMCPTFRVYTSDDIIGVELGGALKNVIALCAGISDGLGYGDNTKAALITRGLAEITRLGTAMNARPATFSGLSGLGDLIVTGTSKLSRNYRAGSLIGSGMTLEDTLEKVHMVVEGVNTAGAAYNLSRKYNVETPIIEHAYKILFEGMDPREAVNMLMTRRKTVE